MRLPLDVLIIQRTQAHLLSIGLQKGERFAVELREQYERLVPEAQRTIRWSDNEVASKRLNNDYQHMARYMQRSPKLPAELVGPWLMTLPAHDRRDILATFLEQFDATLVAITRRDPAKQGDTLSLADLMRECAAAVEAITPMLADGVIGPEDQALARNALLKLVQLVKVATDFQERIASILPGVAS